MKRFDRRDLLEVATLSANKVFAGVIESGFDRAHVSRYDVQSAAFTMERLAAVTRPLALRRVGPEGSELVRRLQPGPSRHVRPGGGSGCRRARRRARQRPFGCRGKHHGMRCAAERPRSALSSSQLEAMW